MTSKPVIFILSFLLTFSFAFSQTSTNVTSLINYQQELCQAINSLNIYERGNLIKVQTFLKQTLFPKIIVSGVNDINLKYYIRKFQYAFGLKQTGILNAQTVKFIRNNYNCFDLEKKVTQIQNSIVVKRPDTQALIQNLVNEILLKYMYNSDVTVTVATTTTN